MTLREVMGEVILKANLDKLIDLKAPDKTMSEYKMLHLAANNVIREIASSYLPLLMREEVQVEDCRLDITKLSRRPIKVVSLKENGTNVHFTMYPTYLYARSGIYDMVYSYLPDMVDLDDEIEVDARVNEDILSNGIASEYYLMVGNVEMGDLYDKKYRENLKNLAVTKHEIKIKGRAFV